MKASPTLFALALAITFLNQLLSQEIAHDTAVTKGPQEGTLLVAGGAAVTPILERFIALAGGTEAPIVYTPTASGAIGDEAREARADILRRLGAVDVTMLHTDDPKIADTESFAEPLRKAKGVWFGGGRQWRIVDAYEGTLTERLFWEVLERGGVIGGSSAGATIQGSYLARGDTRNNQIMVGDHEEGFGFVTNVAIDQHHIARNRHFDMFAILDRYPHLLGIGIDEGTAIEIHGNAFRVLGAGYVAIYDGTFWSREGSRLKQLPDSNRLFYFLRPGDRYDLSLRKVIR
jgi:cyanophycinase